MKKKDSLYVLTFMVIMSIIVSFLLIDIVSGQEPQPIQYWNKTAKRFMTPKTKAETDALDAIHDSKMAALAEQKAARKKLKKADDWKVKSWDELMKSAAWNPTPAPEEFTMTFETGVNIVVQAGNFKKLWNVSNTFYFLHVNATHVSLWNSTDLDAWTWIDDVGSGTEADMDFNGSRFHIVFDVHTDATPSIMYRCYDKVGNSVTPVIAAQDTLYNGKYPSITVAPNGVMWLYYSIRSGGGNQGAIMAIDNTVDDNWDNIDSDALTSFQENNIGYTFFGGNDAPNGNIGRCYVFFTEWIGGAYNICSYWRDTDHTIQAATVQSRGLVGTICPVDMILAGTEHDDYQAIYVNKTGDFIGKWNATGQQYNLGSVTTSHSTRPMIWAKMQANRSHARLYYLNLTTIIGYEFRPSNPDTLTEKTTLWTASDHGNNASGYVARDRAFFAFSMFENIGTDTTGSTSDDGLVFGIYNDPDGLTAWDYDVEMFIMGGALDPNPPAASAWSDPDNDNFFVDSQIWYKDRTYDFILTSSANTSYLNVSTIEWKFNIEDYGDFVFVFNRSAESWTMSTGLASAFQIQDYTNLVQSGEAIETTMRALITDSMFTQGWLDVYMRTNSSSSNTTGWELMSDNWYAIEDQQDQGGGSSSTDPLDDPDDDGIPNFIDPTPERSGFITLQEAIQWLIERGWLWLLLLILYVVYRSLTKDNKNEIFVINRRGRTEWN